VLGVADALDLHDVTLDDELDDPGDANFTLPFGPFTVMDAASR